MTTPNEERATKALQAIDACNPREDCSDLLREALRSVREMDTEGYREEKRQRAIRMLERALILKSPLDVEALLGEARWTIEHIEKH